jgi:hypothetical protein
MAAIWDEIAPTMDPDVGAAGLEALVGQIKRMRDAAKRVEEEGLIVEDAKGNPVSHPAIVVERDAQKEIRAWLSQFRGRKDERRPAESLNFR